MRSSNLKRLFVALGLLTVLLLGTSSEMFPGSAQEETSVSLDVAFTHAAVAMVEAVATKAPSIIGREGAREEWQEAIIGEPLTLFDINTEPLLYSFPLFRKGTPVGTIWVSASKLVGPSVPSKKMGPQPSWNVEKAFARLEELAKEKYPGWEILSFYVVVYSYPKVGAMAILQNPRTGEEARLIIDIADWTVIPYVEPKLRGIGVWSFLDSIPPEQWKMRVERWEADNDWTQKVTTELARKGIDLRDLREEPLLALKWKIIDDWIRQFVICDACIANGGLPTAPVCQETPTWCVVATAKMIAAFYGVDHSQSHIAEVMGTNGGTSWEGELYYYRDCTVGLCKTGSTGTSANWSSAWNEICDDRPFDSSVPWHARAAFGIRECDRIGGPTKRELAIVDPWPPCGAAWCATTPCCCGEAWEDWDTTTYWDSVYVRP